MKLSVSLSEKDVETLDSYVRALGLSSRSAGIQQALRVLAEQNLEENYAEAFAEWEGAGEGAVWDAAGDGLDDQAPMTRLDDQAG